MWLHPVTAQADDPEGLSLCAPWGRPLASLAPFQQFARSSGHQVAALAAFPSHGLGIRAQGSP
ncbi:hypothetical protein D0837_17255 [Bordetella avium]|nr:hypothetical protein D0837_17255 [Bordetella avium]